MRSPQDAIEIEEMERELQTKDTSLEIELKKQIEERKEEVEEKKIEEKVKPKKKLRRRRFGIETVKIPREGVYEINIDALMKKRPLIILEKGRVYLIHLPSVFERVKEE